MFVFLLKRVPLSRFDWVFFMFDTSDVLILNVCTFVTFARDKAHIVFSKKSNHEVSTY